jgi:hypothetical protein
LQASERCEAATLNYYSINLKNLGVTQLFVTKGKEDGSYRVNISYSYHFLASENNCIELARGSYTETKGIHRSKMPRT